MWSFILFISALFSVSMIKMSDSVVSNASKKQEREIEKIEDGVKLDFAEALLGFAEFRDGNIECMLNEIADDLDYVFKSWNVEDFIGRESFGASYDEFGHPVSIAYNIYLSKYGRIASTVYKLTGLPTKKHEERARRMFFIIEKNMNKNGYNHKLLYVPRFDPVSGKEYDMHNGFMYWDYAVPTPTWKYAPNPRDTW